MSLNLSFTELDGCVFMVNMYFGFILDFFYHTYTLPQGSMLEVPVRLKGDSDGVKARSGISGGERVRLDS